MTKRAKRPQPKPQRAEVAPRDKLPIIDHIKELRRRLLYIAASVTVGSLIAYGLEHQIVDVLIHPSHGQKFIYTSPMGGMNFLFTICLQIGLLVSTPVIIYQILAFIRPLMKQTTRRYLLIASSASGFVAFCGVLFGYFAGLPSALHFLLHQFTTVQVRPLINIQDYLKFVAVYLLGCALMFQLPLIILFINRIKPLRPQTLLKYERHLIVGAFVVAFIMNPSPNIVDQLLVVVPIIVTYQLSILMIWAMQRSKKPTHVQLLREQDAERQAERANLELTPLTLPFPDDTVLTAEEQVLQPFTQTASAPAQAEVRAEETAAIIPKAIAIAAEGTEEAVVVATPKPQPAAEPAAESVAVTVKVKSLEPAPPKKAPIRITILDNPRPYIAPAPRPILTPLPRQLIQW